MYPISHGVDWRYFVMHEDGGHPAIEIRRKYALIPSYEYGGFQLSTINFNRIRVLCKLKWRFSSCHVAIICLFLIHRSVLRLFHAVRPTQSKKPTYTY